MGVQKIISEFEIITTLIQKRIRDIAVERAYTLAVMAVRGECPDERFSEKECEVWNRYRYWYEVMNSIHSED